jgi:hypothetical protein
MPTVTANPKGDRARGGNPHAIEFEAHRIGRQAQAPRPLAPNEFAEAQNNQRKAQRRHRAHDRIAMGEAGRDQTSVEQRQRR